MYVLAPLNDAQIDRVVDATEDLIENTGCRVLSAELLGILASAGAVVDDRTGCVTMDRKLFRELLDLVPSSFTLAGIDGTRAVVGGGTTYCEAIVTDPWIVDFETNSPRRPVLDDVKRHTIIAQSLPEVVAASVMDFPAEDIPGSDSSLQVLEAHLMNYGKHNYAYPADMERFGLYRDIHNVYREEYDPGDGILLSVAVGCQTPLVINDLNAALLLNGIQEGFVIIPTCCPMAGSTAPYSVASNLLLANTETLFLAAAAQAVRPGTPYVYGYGPSVTDLRSGLDLYYTLDKIFWKAASGQLGKRYGIPLKVELGGSMSYHYDIQAGAETFISMLAAVSTQPSLLGSLGTFCNACGMGAEMMLIQAAWFDAACHLAKGMSFDEDVLGLERIRLAGPGGNFFVDDLTIRFMRGGEFFTHPLFNYSGEPFGSKSMLDLAHDKVQDMVSGFDSPVPGRIRERIRAVLNREKHRVLV